MDRDGPRNKPSDPRMISGAVIANVIFLHVTDVAAGDGVLHARLTASDAHEVWLESTGGLLQALPGHLRIVDVERNVARSARLTRDADGYRVDLTLPRVEREQIARLAVSRDGAFSLTLGFDVEYREGYESPGGYAPDYGVRYWDDVAYPSVYADRFEFA